MGGAIDSLSLDCVCASRQRLNKGNKISKPCPTTTLYPQPAICAAPGLQQLQSQPGLHARRHDVDALLPAHRLHVQGREGQPVRLLDAGLERAPAVPRRVGGGGEGARARAAAAERGPGVDGRAALLAAGVSGPVRTRV